MSSFASEQLIPKTRQPNPDFTFWVTKGSDQKCCIFVMGRLTVAFSNTAYLSDIENLHREHLRKFQHLIEIGNESGDDEHVDSSLQELITHSRFMFENVFLGSDKSKRLQDDVENFRLLLAEIREFDDLSRLPVIQFIVEEVSLPWEFLYLSSEDDEDIQGNLLGLRAHVYRDIRRSISHQQNTHHGFDLAVDTLRLLAAWSKSEDIRDSERRFLKERIHGEKALVDELPSLSRKKLQRAKKDFVDHWKRGYDIIHFGCHSTNDPETSYCQSLLFDSDFYLDEACLDSIADQLEGTSSFLILNSCHSANISCEFVSWIAVSFLRAGIRGAVCVDGSVGKEFATLFSEKFYESWLSPFIIQNEGSPVASQTLGDSIMNLRREFWRARKFEIMRYVLFARPEYRFLTKN